MSLETTCLIRNMKKTTSPKSNDMHSVTIVKYCLELSNIYWLPNIPDSLFIGFQVYLNLLVIKLFGLRSASSLLKLIHWFLCKMCWFEWRNEIVNFSIACWFIPKPLLLIATCHMKWSFWHNTACAAHETVNWENNWQNIQCHLQIVRLLKPLKIRTTIHLHHVI